MRVAISISPKITSHAWIDTQLIDCLFELDDIETFLIPQNVHSKHLGEFIKLRKKKLLYFLDDLGEHGIAAISKKNIEIVNQTDFLLALWDGESRCTKNMIDLALRKKIPFNVRFYGRGT